MLFSLALDWTLPTPGASKTTNMHADAAMDMEKLFGVYGGVIKQPPWKLVDSGPKRLCHKQSISEGTHDPWKDQVFFAQVSYSTTIQEGVWKFGERMYSST